MYLFLLQKLGISTNVAWYICAMTRVMQSNTKMDINREITNSKSCSTLQPWYLRRHKRAGGGGKEAGRAV
jgi:hypothetical protein